MIGDDPWNGTFLPDGTALAVVDRGPRSQQSRHYQQSPRDRGSAPDTADDPDGIDLNAEREARNLKAWDAAELDDRPVRWLAPGWLPSAAVAVLVGDEGIGKSLWWVRVAAHMTTGMADPTINLPAGPPRVVMLVLTEDLWGEVKARLILAGADLRYVKVLCDASDGSGNPVLPGPDAKVVFKAARACHAALVVVDAWLDTVKTGLRVADTQQAREALIPWANIAEIADACVLLLAHTNRLGTTSTRDKVGGTVALRQKARMLLYAATPDDEIGQVVYVGPDKVNNIEKMSALRYELDVVQVRTPDPHDPGTTARLAHPEDSTLAIGQLVKRWARDDAEVTRGPSALDRVKAVVLEALATGAPGVDRSPDGTQFMVVTSELKRAIFDAGLNTDRLGDAVIALGGNNARPQGFGGKWVATIPTTALQQCQSPPAYSSKTAGTAETADTGGSPRGGGW